MRSYRWHKRVLGTWYWELSGAVGGHGEVQDMTACQPGSWQRGTERTTTKHTSLAGFLL